MEISPSSSERILISLERQVAAEKDTNTLIFQFHDTLQKKLALSRIAKLQSIEHLYCFLSAVTYNTLASLCCVGMAVKRSIWINQIHGSGI